MALIRQYFTYIPQLLINSDYPSGALIRPYQFFELNFGPTETMHEDENFVQHYLGEDCRRLAWIEGDSAHMSNASNISVAEFIAIQGLLNFCSVPLTINEALELAKLFSPSRTINVLDENNNVKNMLVQDCVIDENKIIQNIVDI